MIRTILVVEDEKNIRQAIVTYLGNADYKVIEADNGREAIEKFENNIVDLVILDVMLPVYDGWTVLRHIREMSDTMVIMLTALESEFDKLQGFKLGVDEYITKPFSPRVLVARVKAMFNRHSHNINPSKKIVIGNLILDKTSHKVMLNGEKLALTSKEYMILEYMLENEKCALTRDQILETVWGYVFFGSNRVVDTHIKNLRKKLKEEGRHIQTIKNVGYCFEAYDEEKNRKIGIQLFVITTIVISVMIGLLLIVHSVFFERFYLSWKTRNLNHELTKFSLSITKDDLSYLEFLEIKQQFMYANTADILVLCEDGQSLEQKLLENQEWSTLLIEYDNGVRKKVLLSEYDFSILPAGKSLLEQEIYYVLPKDINDDYQQVLGIVDSSLFEKIEGLSFSAVIDNEEVVKWQKARLIETTSSTQYEIEKYSVMNDGGFAVYNTLDNYSYDISYDNNEQLSLETIVKNEKGESLKIYLIASLQPVGEASAAITSYYPWFFTIAIITAVIVAFIYSRIVSRPIIQISKVADEMSKGKLDARIQTKHKNEIGILGDSLNLLSISLQKSINELESANNQLIKDIKEKEEQERVRRDFTANISHDLKTPLGVIRCYIDLLRDNIEPDKREYFFDTIEDEVDKINNMTLQMLELAKVESGDIKLEKTRISIKELTNNTIDMFKHITKERCLQFIVKGNYMDMIADNQKIEQVFVNLLSNAVNYSLENSKIIIYGEKKGDKCKISIENQCNNISQSEADSFFKRFYTYDKARNKNGTGLGLAICEAIFKLHGFDYGVISHKGSIVFWFEYLIADNNLKMN